MHIAVITSRFAPEASSAAKRAADLAGALREAGHRVTVLTQMPNYPDPAAFDRQAPAGTNVEIESDGDGSATWRFAPALAAKRDLLGRFLAEARFALRVSRGRTGLSGLDGVFASTPFVFNLVAARTYPAPLWLDVRDLTWEYARDLWPNSRVKRLGAGVLRSIALSSLRRARCISTTTERQRRYLIERGMDAGRIEVVPNGVPRRVAEELRRLAAAAPGEETGPLKLVYAGLLGFPQGLEFAVRSFEELSGISGSAGGGMELHLYGDGADRRKLADYCRSRGLRSVHVHGYIPYDRYLERIAAADILLASLRPEVESAMPAKLWEYMAAGKPILFAGTGEAAEAIAAAGAGVSVAYGDRRRFGERLLELARDPALRRQMGEAGREWVFRHRIREEINRTWVERLEEVFSAASQSLSQNSIRRTEAERKAARQGGPTMPYKRSNKARARSEQWRSSETDAEWRPCSRPNPGGGFGIGSKPAGGRNVRNGRGAPGAGGWRRPWIRRSLRGAAALAARGAELSGILRLLEWGAGGRAGRLAVLAYHRIADDRAEPLPCPGLVSASPQTFAEQLAFLAAKYRIVSMEEVLEAFRGGRPLPPRAVLLTFDDGYADFAGNAWPHLKRCGLPATLFVPTAFPDHPERVFWWDRLFQSIVAAKADSCSTRFGELDLGTASERLDSYRRLRDGIKALAHEQAMEVVEQVCAELGSGRPAPAVLGWDALRSLAREGVALGAHGRTHALLDRIPRDKIREEVSGALADLKREIGEAPPIFAYPAGRYSDQAIQVLAEEGIELAFATRSGINDLRRREESLRLRRIHLGPRTTRPILRAQLLGLRPPRVLRSQT